MAETLATSCATSGVPMLFTDVLSEDIRTTCLIKRTFQGDQVVAAPLVHGMRSCQLVS
jgi:hypothetical protein